LLKAQSAGALGWYLRRFAHHKLALTGVVVMAILVASSVLAPLIAPHDPYEQNIDQRLEPGFWAGNWEYPLGLDRVGRCIFSRIVYGGRLTLTMGIISIGLAGVLGTAIGVMSGFSGGVVDLVTMRVVDILLNFPTLILALAISAALGAGIDKAMLAVGIAYTPLVARVVRGSVLSVKERTFIDAARVAGTSNSWIILKHILPNIAGPTVVYLSLCLADGILYAASLGFLGLGAQPPQAEWGTMLGQGRDFLLLGVWWMVMFPGLAILVTVLCLNAIGDGLRDAIDPTTVMQ